jgi:hypothetical protein
MERHSCNRLPVRERTAKIAEAVSRPFSCPHSSPSASPHCELDDRHFVKYLPFRKLQPPRKIKGFVVLSHSLPAPHCVVLRILSTNWPQIFGVKFGSYSGHPALTSGSMLMRLRVLARRPIQAL